MPKLQVCRTKDGKHSRYLIAVPCEYVRLLGWKPKDEFLWYPKEEGTMLLKHMQKAVQEE